MPEEATLAPLGRAWHFQRLHLRTEALKSAAAPPADVGGPVRVPAAFEVGFGGATFLCRPVPTNDGYLQVSPAVSLWKKEEAERELESAAECLAKLKKVSVSGPRAVIRKGYRKEEVAGRLTAVVVTEAAGRGVDAADLLLALDGVAVVAGGRAVVDLTGSRLGRMMGVRAVVSRVDAADVGVVFTVKSGQTEIDISRQVCLERMEALAALDVEMPNLGGLSRQTKWLRDLVRSGLGERVGFVGILLSGPAGSGKTALLERVAREEGLLTKTAHCSDLLRSEEGETGQEIRRIFDDARLHSQEGGTMLVLDSLELLCPSKDNAKAHELRNLSTLVNCLDLCDKARTKLVVVGVTSKAQSVDMCLRRPGRLGHDVCTGIPNVSDRTDIVRILVGDWPDLADVVTPEEVAAVTPGYVGGDVKLFLSRLATNVRESGGKSDCIAATLREVPPTGLRSGIGVVEVQPVSWDSVGGLQEAKTHLRRAVEWPLKHPEKFEQLGLRPPRGCLLYGPPGCGKTKLVRAAASSASAVFLSVSAASVFSPYVGDSEKAISELFDRARMAAPAVIFIDEIDSLVSSRDGGRRGNGVKEKVLSTLLNEMDGVGVRRSDGVTGQQRRTEAEAVDSAGRSTPAPTATTTVSSVDNKDVFVVFATNRPQDLDSALCRPGRIDSMVYVPPPDEASKRAIVRKCLEKTKTDGSVDVDALSSHFPELSSGADVESACREAVMKALRRCGPELFEEVLVTEADLREAVSELKPSITAKMMAVYENFSRSSRTS